MERNLVRCTGHNIHQSAVHFTEGCWCFLFPLNEKSEMVRESSWATQSNGQRVFKKSKSRTQEAETFVFSCEWRHTDSPQIYLLIHVLIFLAHTTVVTHMLPIFFIREFLSKYHRKLYLQNCLTENNYFSSFDKNLLCNVQGKREDKAQIIVI